MLSIKQLEKLYQILNSQEITLDKIHQNFQINFNDSYALFRACYGLSNLLLLNLLTNQQRIIAIFILTDNYKAEGIKKHPFGATIFDISAKTSEPFQRKMIAEIIMDFKRDKYAKVKIEALYQEEQAICEYIEERPQMQKLKHQFISNMPKISSNLKSQVRNVVSDFNEKQKSNIPPQHSVNKVSIKQAQLSHQGYNVSFLRPIPKFIEVSSSQFHWLSPSVVTDVHWDNTAQLQKKLQKAKKNLQKGLNHHLTKDEYNQIERVLDAQSYAVLNLGLTPENLGGLIKQNPYIVVSFLTKLSQYPIIQSYLQALQKAELSINSIDVMIRLVKGIRLPNQFVTKYILTIMKEVRNIPQNNKDRSKLSKLIANFIKTMTKYKIINPQNIKEALDEFTSAFIDVEQVQTLLKLYKRE